MTAYDPQIYVECDQCGVKGYADMELRYRSYNEDSVYYVDPFELLSSEDDPVFIEGVGNMCQPDPDENTHICEDCHNG